MRVTPTSFTVAEYCQQMIEKKIIVNRNYQRSSAVWPQAAKSFLIDTILTGFPIPKLSLYQKTDLRTRATIKEIVDGQQRSHAILDFFNDDLRVTSKGEFQGKLYSGLTQEQQQAFLDYQLSVDFFVDATEADIRELFRRVNSYNVPLNPQEKRHSTYQGPFKWFILEQSNRYAQTFKDIKTFSESQLARMEDAKFLADICLAFTDGIISASETRLDKLYRSFDETFPAERLYAQRISEGIDKVLLFRDELGDELTKKFQLYCIILSFIHIEHPIDSLQVLYESHGTGIPDMARARERLSRLCEAVATGEDGGSAMLRAFIENSAKTTDRQVQRSERFAIICNSLS
jgi:hypothetical protein